MSLITVEVARFGHAKKKTKVKLRQGMLWKDFLELLCSKMRMAPNTSLEVTDQRGHSISSTKDLRDKAILILRESNTPDGSYQNVEDVPRRPPRTLPKRAHSFGGHDIALYSSIGHGAMSPGVQSRPLPMSPLVPVRPLPRAPSRNSIYSTPAMSPPPPTRGRGTSIPVYGSAMLPRKQSAMSSPPPNRMLTLSSQHSRLSPQKQSPMSPPPPSRMLSMPQQGSAMLSPLLTRSHVPQAQLKRFHSQLQVGPSIVNPFVCSLLLLEKVSQETDSLIVIAESKESSQKAKFYRVKIAFVRTDIQGFRHPYENEVLILQNLRAASNHKSAAYIVQSAGSTYCRTREDFSLLHNSMRREIMMSFKQLMDFTPGNVFITAYPLGLDTLQDKSTSGVKPEEALAYGLEILKCFLFLQQHGVIHRSPKLSKFQISADSRIRLSDFENSVIINSNTLLFHYRNVGPFGTNLSRMDTLAPDVLNTHARHEVAPGYPDDSVNYSSQYSWSFGVLFNMLVSGNHPLPNYPTAYGPPGQINYWPNQINLSTPKEFPPEVRESIRQCLSANPNHRYSLHQLLHIFTEAQKNGIQNPALSSSSTVLTSASSSSDLQKSWGKEDLYSRVKKPKRNSRRWMTQPVGVKMDQIMQVQLDNPGIVPTMPLASETTKVASTEHEIRSERAKDRGAILQHPLGCSSAVNVHSEEGECVVSSVVETEPQFVSNGNHEPPSTVVSSSLPVQRNTADSSTLTVVEVKQAPQYAEAQVISIDIPDSDEECNQNGSLGECGPEIEIKEISPPIKEPEVVSIAVRQRPDSGTSSRSVPTDEGPPPYTAVAQYNQRGQGYQPHAVPYSQPLPRKHDVSGISRYHSYDRMNLQKADSSIVPKPFHDNIENRVAFPIRSEDSLHSQRRQPSGLVHPDAAGSVQLEAPQVVSLKVENDVMSGSSHNSENTQKPSPVQHGVIGNGSYHGSSSRSSYEEGHTVPIEYFPSCFSQDDDRVFSEANNHQEDKNVVFLKPPPLTISSDVQRSHSLNRGRKSAPELHPFGRVSARGPQTRSVYDLRGEDTPSPFSNGCSPKDLLKVCGHSCLIDQEQVCCLCKKNASWTFSGDGVDSAAFWSKGCHMCRRRTTETNQLSTVSRPRAELLGTASSKATDNLKEGKAMQQNTLLVPSAQKSSHKNGKQRVSSSTTSKREKSCCVM